MMPWEPLVSDFVQLNPAIIGNRALNPKNLKIALLLANNRLDIVEEHARQGDLRIENLEDQLKNFDTNLYYAEAKIHELNDLISEQKSQLEQHRSIIHNFEENRFVPPTLPTFLNQPNASVMTVPAAQYQTVLRTLQSKNVQLCQLHKNEATMASEEADAPTLTPTTAPSMNVSTADDNSVKAYIHECSMGLANMTDFERNRSSNRSTENLLQYSNQKYITELAASGGRPFLDFVATVVDNADNISREKRGVTMRDECDKIFSLARLEVNVLANICEYLVGSVYSWTFAFLYCVVELAGKRSKTSQTRLGKVLPGAPSLALLRSFMVDTVFSRKLELQHHTIPAIGEMISLHDNAAKSYFEKSSRQSSLKKSPRKGHVCALVLAIITENLANGSQFLQGRTENAPLSVFKRLPSAPDDLLDHTQVEKNYLKQEFLGLIQAELVKMRSNGYCIGDGSKLKNPKPIIKKPIEVDEVKQHVSRECPGCGKLFDWDYKNRICYEIYTDEDGKEEMCGHTLPTKERALLDHLLSEDNVEEEAREFRNKVYGDVDEPLDVGAVHREKLRRKIVQAAQYIVTQGDPREFIHHYGGWRTAIDDRSSWPSRYSKKYAQLFSNSWPTTSIPPTSSTTSSSAASSSADARTLDIGDSGVDDLEEAIKHEKNISVDYVPESEEYNQPEGNEYGEDSSDSHTSAGSKRRAQGVFTGNKDSRKRVTMQQALKFTILPQGIIHGNPGTKIVMEKLREKRLRDAKVHGHTAEGVESTRSFIAICQDMGTTSCKFYKSERELFLLPWLHTLMNFNKKILDLIKYGDNKHSNVAAIYGYSSLNAQRCFFGNADNHKGQDATLRYFLPAGIRHLTHTGADILGSGEASVTLEEMTAEKILEAVKAQEGPTCHNFIALLEEAVFPLHLLCKLTRAGPKYQAERIAAQKCFVPLSGILGQKDYFPANTWDIILREYLYSQEVNPEMHEWMKNVAMIQVNEDDVWLAIDEIIEHWVRKWKSCCHSNSEFSYDFAEALASDIDCLKEKLNFLMGQLDHNKKERAWTDLEPYIQNLTAFFDHYGTCRGTTDGIFRSFDGTEMKEINKAMGKVLASASYANLRRYFEFLPVSPSFLGAEFVENTPDEEEEVEEVDQEQGVSNMATA